MRYFIRFFLACCLLVNFTAWAQDPVPFTLVTLSGVGSQSDGAARFFAPLLSEALKQPVVVANHPGGNGTIGIKKYYDLPADCNSLLIGHSTNAYVSKFMKGMIADPLQELVPLHGMATSAMMILVGGNSGIYTVDDLVSKYKREGRLTGASTIPTTAMSLGLFDTEANVKTAVVNYKIASQAALDIAAGLVDYTFSLAGNSAYQGLINDGKIRAIAVVDSQRSSYYAGVKTLAEQGYKGHIETFSWNGFFTHARTTPECKSRLSATLEKVMRSAEAQKYTDRAGAPQLFMLRGPDIQRLLVRERNAMAALSE